MTDVDKGAFATAMAGLCLSLREKNPDAAQLRAYFEALRDLEIEFVVEAANRLSRATNSDGEAWFPKAAEWRQMAAKVERDRRDELTARLRKLPTPLCLVCNDTGWQRDESDRVQPCTCRHQRRLEVLGRRPMPALPSGPVELDAEDVTPERLAQAVKQLAIVKGIR